MKRLFKILTVVTILSTTMSCTENFNDEIHSSATEEFVKLSIAANLSTGTRTLIGASADGKFPFNWESTDELAIVEYADNKLSQVSKAKITSLENDDKSALFEAELLVKSGSTFDYYAYYPYNAYDNAQLTLPTEQMAKETSVDPAAILLHACAKGENRQNTTLDYMFDHLTAYAKMSVTGLNMQDDDRTLIRCVKFTAEGKNLSGTFAHDISNGSISITSGQSHVSTALSHLGYDRTVQTFDVWFATLPTEKIESFTVEITTGLYTYTKVFKVNRDFGLERGIISYFTVDMKNAVAEKRECPNNEIRYTSTDGKIVNPSHYIEGETFGDGVSIISNTYKNGEGVILCNNDITRIGYQVINYFGPASWTFLDCNTLSNVTLPNSVTVIGAFAFSCRNLKDIVMSDNIYLIGEYAFQLSDIQEVTLPTSTTTIYQGAFAYTPIRSIHIPENVTYIDHEVFYRCVYLEAFYGKFATDDHKSIVIPSTDRYNRTELVSYAIGCKDSKYTVPEDVTFIDAHAFTYAKYLKAVNLPDNLTHINYSSFGLCFDLSSITIPENVTSLSSQAFYACENLKEVFCKPKTPPVDGNGENIVEYFANTNAELKIYVPRQSVDAYKKMWSLNADQIFGYDF